MPMVSQALLIIWKMCADKSVALVTGQLAKDLTIIGQEIEKLYGVLHEDDLRLQ
jgi:hypothetical protein